MENKSNTLLTLFLMLLLLAVLIGAGYYFYLNIPADPERLSVDVDGPTVRDAPLLPVQQFYPNMKFNHNVISYNIDVNCVSEKKERMRAAFDMLEEEVGIIAFEESLFSDIEITCSADDIESDEDFFVAGEGGARQIIQTGSYNVITNGTILLLDSEKRFLKCNWPNIELHELLHVFGFDHSTDKKSIMYPFLQDCNQQLDTSIVNEIVRLYSVQNLPDLYFEDVSAIKKGRYLDFNLTIRNGGLVDVNDVSFSVIDEGEIVEKRVIGDLKVGAGLSIKITNFKLFNRNSLDIRIVIDRDEEILESNEENNVAVLG